VNDTRAGDPKGLSRRRLLGVAGGAAAVGALGPYSSLAGGAGPEWAGRRHNGKTREWRVALNTIQWIATPEGWIDPTLLPPLTELLPLVKQAGFDAVHPDIPAGMSTQEYLRLLRENCLVPSSGYLSLRLPEEGVPVETTLENARLAAQRHVEMGLRTIFLAMSQIRTAPRVAQPARGAAFDQARLDRVTELVRQVSRVLVAGGVRPALHQHVGGWIETEYELRYVLDNVGRRLLDFGPDVGHLTWAGIDPVRIIRQYRDRVAGVHIKDVRGDIAAASRTGAWSYLETVARGVWIEPGRGDVDLHAVFDALPRKFRGWIIVENDRPDLPVWESAVYSAAWMRMNLPGRERDRRECRG
jgi:inosose dehydratase